jgi:glycosyltransferase involved in cell wall biosynthesis
MGTRSRLKRRLVISAVNFREGGPLSLTRDCLTRLDRICEKENWRVVALVSDKKLYADLSLRHVALVSFPKAQRSYAVRLFYEYYWFNLMARRNQVDFWLSLHDISPRVGTVPQAVYCHNPAPFHRASWREFRLEPVFGMFSVFYGLMYRINIRRNRYVIVQQEWLRRVFVKLYHMPARQIIVARPEISLPSLQNKPARPLKTFIFPTFPRVFKNVEVIGEAVRLLLKKGITSFEILVTLDGTETRYARWLKANYGGLSNLKFIGSQSRSRIFELYAEVDALIFPSKLETWGLPISEFKQTGKPVFAADLPYAHETARDYKNVFFFDAEHAGRLASLLEAYILHNTLPAQAAKPVIAAPPVSDTWEDLFKILMS